MVCPHNGIISSSKNEQKIIIFESKDKFLKEATNRRLYAVCFCIFLRKF